MKEDNCCNKPKYIPAYIMHKPFKCKYCNKCGSVTMNCNPIAEWIFTYIFSPFWNGEVYESNGNKID